MPLFKGWKEARKYSPMEAIIVRSILWCCQMIIFISNWCWSSRTDKSLFYYFSNTYNMNVHIAFRCWEHRKALLQCVSYKKGQMLSTVPEGFFLSLILFHCWITHLYFFNGRHFSQKHCSMLPPLRKAPQNTRFCNSFKKCCSFWLKIQSECLCITHILVQIIVL